MSPQNTRSYFSQEAALKLLPDRLNNGNKGTYGHVVIVGGCDQYIGAPIMAGLAAYRSGCGLVELFTPTIVRTCAGGCFQEAIWNCFNPLTNVPEQLMTAARNASVLVIGPGIGQSEPVKKFLPECFLELQKADRRIPMIIDADALNILSVLRNWYEILPENCVLTPHPGEMARLTGKSITQIQSDRENLTISYAERWGKVVLLKGAHTIISDAHGNTVTLPFASSALSVAGSGDILSGIIGSLCAQGVPVFEAACLGGWIHGQSGLTAAKNLGTERSVMPRDILHAIPTVIASLEASVF